MNPDDLITGNAEVDEQRKRVYQSARQRGESREQAVDRAMRVLPHQSGDPDIVGSGNIALKAVGDVVRTGAQGATLGFADEIEGGLRGLGAAIVPGGRSFSEGYTEGRDQARESVGRLREISPGVSLASEIAGGVAGARVGAQALTGLAGAGRAAGAGRVASMAGRGAQGALNVAKGAYRTTPRMIAANAGLAGVYGAGSAEGGIGERAGAAVPAAAVGGAAGAVMGPIARGAYKVLSKPGRAAIAGAAVGGGLAATDGINPADAAQTALVAAAAASPSTVGRLVGPKLPRIGRRVATSLADDAVREATKADGVTPATARASINRAGRLRGPEMSLADMGGNAMGLAQGASSRPGSTAASLSDEFAERVGGRVTRTTADLEDAFGVPSDIGERLLPANKNLRDQGVLPRLRGREADRAYNPGRGNIAPREVREALTSDDPVMDEVRRMAADNIMRRARNSGTPQESVDDVINRLKNGTLANMDDAMSVRRALDEVLGRTKVDAGSLNREAAGLVRNDVRRPLDAAMKEASPAIRAGDAAFSRRSSQMDALDLARGVGTGNKRFSQKTPDQVRLELAGLRSPDEELMYRVGALEDIRKNIDNTGNIENRVAGRNDESFNEQTLRMILGDDAAGELGERLATETRMQETADAVVRNRNSRTAWAELQSGNIENFSDIKQVALQTFRDLFPKLRTATNTADEIGRVMRLRGDDLVGYLEELQRRYEAQLLQSDTRTGIVGAAGALGTVRAGNNDG